MIELPRIGYSLSAVFNKINTSIKNEDFSEYSLRWTRSNGSQLTIKQESEFQQAFEAALQSGESYLDLVLHPIQMNTRSQPPRNTTTQPVRNNPPTNTTTNTNTTNQNTGPSGSKSFDRLSNQMGTGTAPPSNNSGGRTNNPPPQTGKQNTIPIQNSPPPQFSGTLITSYAMNANRSSTSDKVDITVQKNNNVVTFIPVASNSQTDVQVILETDTVLNFVLQYDIVENGQRGRMTLTKTFNMPRAIFPSMFTVDGNRVTLNLN